MSRSSSTRFLQGMGILLVFMFGQAILPPPPDTILWSATLDAGHVPLFGLMAYAVLRLSLASFPQWHPRLSHYLLALAVTVVVGFLTEGAQLFVGRNANLMDQERNILGASAALLLAMAMDREVLGGRASWRPALRVTAIALVVVAWIPPATAAVSYFERNAAFPSLCGFDHGWEMHFTRTRDAELKVVDPPRAWRTAHGRVGKITYRPVWYPAFSLRGVWDWTGYDRLALEIFSPADTTLTVGLRIDDVAHDEEFHDRFHRELFIEPGANAVTISLEDVRDAPEQRSMDMQHVRSIALFAYHPEQAFSLYLDSLRLERE